MDSEIFNTAREAIGQCLHLQGIGYVICKLQQFLNAIIPVLVALGVVYFIWGVVQYVIGGGEEAKTKGKDRMIYGIIGLAVIISFAGIVNVIVKTFGFGGQSLTAPNLVTTTTQAASGAICTVGNTFQGLVGYVICLINNSIIPLIFAIAIVMFIWGAVKFFIINSDEEAKREQGKQFMLWGVVALAVMMSVWGLVGLFRSTFDKNGSRSVLPQACPPGDPKCNGGK
ncbi:MAG: pilin [Candidatus Paceibacterota bacterium]